MSILQDAAHVLVAVFAAMGGAQLYNYTSEKIIKCNTVYDSSLQRQYVFAGRKKQANDTSSQSELENVVLWTEKSGQKKLYLFDKKHSVLFVQDRYCDHFYIDDNFDNIVERKESYCIGPDSKTEEVVKDRVGLAKEQRKFANYMSFVLQNQDTAQNLFGNAAERSKKESLVESLHAIEIKNKHNNPRFILD